MHHAEILKKSPLCPVGTKFLPVWNILPPVHVMSNFSIIKLIDCCRSVIQYRQHILPDILHFACTPVKTEKHILDVFIPDFEQTALDHLCRHSFPIDLLICLCRTYCIQHQLYQLFYSSSSIALTKDLIFDIIMN